MRAMVKGAVALVMLAAPVHAAPQQVVTLQAADQSGCVRFKLLGSAAWYGFSEKDVGFQENWALLLLATNMGRPVSFSLPAASGCGSRATAVTALTISAGG